MKCKFCGGAIKADCDWRQGRCPHADPIFNVYSMRYYNLLQAIKNKFKRKK